MATLLQTFRLLLLSILLLLYGASLNAQISFSSKHVNICTWNERLEEWEDCKNNAYPSLFVINEQETMLTIQSEAGKWVHFIKSSKEENNDVTLSTVDEEGDKWTVFVSMSNAYIALWQAEVSVVKGYFFKLSTVFTDEDRLSFDKEEEKGPQMSTGSGFALTSNGYIATNYHVVENAEKLEVYGIKGGKERFRASVVAQDKERDLAIIKIADPDFQGLGTIPYSISYNIAEPGEEIFVLGYPDPTNLGLEIKLTDGLISSQSGYQGDQTIYQISAPVQGGNSGGPVFDKKGHVIGVVVAEVRSMDNVSYAIKTPYLIDLFEGSAYGADLSSQAAMANRPVKDQVRIAKDFVYVILVNFFEEGERDSYDNDVATNEGQREEESTYTEDDREAEKGSTSISLLERAKGYLNNGEIAEALQVLDEAIENDYQNHEAFFYRGWIKAYYTYDYSGAISDYSESLKSFSEVSFVYYERGKVYADLSKYIDAVMDFNSALKIDPNDLDAYFARALAKSELGDLDASISDYREILKRYMTSSETRILIGTVYNNIASALIEMGELAEAERYLNKAIELEPNESYIWGTKGELLYFKGQYQECINALTKAIDLEDKRLSKATSLEPGAPYYFRGMAKVKLGKAYEACADIQKANRLEFYAAKAAINQYCD